MDKERLMEFLTPTSDSSKFVKRLGNLIFTAYFKEVPKKGLIPDGVIVTTLDKDNTEISVTKIQKEECKHITDLLFNIGL